MQDLEYKKAGTSHVKAWENLCTLFKISIIGITAVLIILAITLL